MDEFHHLAHGLALIVHLLAAGLLLAEEGQLFVGLLPLLSQGQKLLFHLLELGEVPGIGDHQSDVAVVVEHGGAGDQHLLVQPVDGGHRVHPRLLLQHPAGDRAGIQDPLGFDVRHLAPDELFRLDAGGAGVGLVDEQNGARAVGDMDAVIEVLADPPVIRAVQLSELYALDLLLSHPAAHLLIKYSVVVADKALKPPARKRLPRSADRRTGHPSIPIIIVYHTFFQGESNIFAECGVKCAPGARDGLTLGGRHEIMIANARRIPRRSAPRTERWKSF